ncbi:MAG: SCO family protein [Acidobacteria bacterium]|nr:SCO family protein [Acidobacteriota bacterium]
MLAACSPEPPLPSYGVVPDFVLTDHRGQAFRSSEKLNGRLWVADFIFTNCGGPCPRMTSQMRHVRDAVASVPNAQMVSFTVDPARDTPEVLAAYARRFRADSANWHFLTGAPSDLHHLSRNVFRLGDIDGTLEHSTRFVLVDGQSRIRGFYDTSEAGNIDKLITDLKRLAGVSG